MKSYEELAEAMRRARAEFAKDEAGRAPDTTDSDTRTDTDDSTDST